MCICNAGTGPALELNQTGSQPIVDFQDDGTSAFYIEDGGHVGIGTNNPSSALHIEKTITGDASQFEITNGCGAAIKIGITGSGTNENAHIKTHSG